MKDEYHISSQNVVKPVFMRNISHSRHSVDVTMVVSKADIENFEQDGAIVLRNVFSKEWVQKVQEGIQVTYYLTKKLKIVFLSATRLIWRNPANTQKNLPWKKAR